MFKFKPRSLISILWLAVFIVACEPVTAKPATTTPPSTANPTVTRVNETPTNTPAVVVAFPTAVPTPTPILPTSVPTPSQRVSPALPLAQLVSPSINAQISLSQTVNVIAFASSENGVARIEITDDGIPLRVDNPTSPVPIWSVTAPWTPNQIGPHVLRAVAYDSQNRAGAPDEVAVTVIQDARKPTSIIVYPIGLPQIEFASPFQVYGIATDEAGVTQVDLWVDNQIYTYLASQNASGQVAFPFVFVWNALLTGQHTLFVRAHDTQEQTTDSTPLKILVVDTGTPSLSIAFDRTNAPANEPITITVTALDVAGIQRIELLSGKEIFSTITSPNPARQTTLSGQVVLQNPNAGDYQIIARAYNANGNVKESSAQTISFLRAGQSTPTVAVTATPTRPRARATATPRNQPPPPPKIEITSLPDRFTVTAPLRVTFAAQGNAELDRIELWGAYPGQPNPQIVCTIDAHATTQKTGQCEWTPPSAGVVSLYAQAVDIYRQFGRSATISGFIGNPILPTATPTPLSTSARWTAATSSGAMTATLRQTGTTVRGDFKMAGVETLGRITTGTIRGDRLTFTVDLTPPGTESATPSANALTIDFDCVVDLNAGTMSCTYRDSRGRTGAAFFRRENTP